jgi:hypothetical protein
VGTPLGDASQRADTFGFLGTDSPSSPYPLLPAKSPENKSTDTVAGEDESSREISRSPVSLSLRPVLSLKQVQESGESFCVLAWSFRLSDVQTHQQPKRRPVECKAAPVRAFCVDSKFRSPDTASAPAGEMEQDEATTPRVLWSSKPPEPQELLAAFEEIKGALQHLRDARRLGEGAKEQSDLTSDANLAPALLSADLGSQPGTYKCSACETESTCDASGACAICGELVRSWGVGGRQAAGKQVRAAGSKVDGLDALKVEILDLIAGMLPATPNADKPGKAEGGGEREGAGLWWLSRISM